MNFESFLKEVENPQMSAEGWRGVVFSGFYTGKKIAIKKSKHSKFDHCIKNEIETIKKLSGFPSIPQLYKTGEDFLAVEFIEGLRFDKYLKLLASENKIGEIEKIILKLTDVLYFYDIKGFFKKELKRCTNNILVNNKGEIYFIDFEKSRFGIYNKNIPQFLQFLKYIDILDMDSALSLGKSYSETFNIEKVKIEIKKAIKENQFNN